MKEQIKKLRYNSRHYEQLLQQIAKRQHALKTEGNLQIIKEMTTPSVVSHQTD